MYKPLQSALLAVTGSKGETSVFDKLHNHFDHVLIRQKPQQLASKTTVPDSVISSCQIDKYSISLFLTSKESSMFWVSRTT